MNNEFLKMQKLAGLITEGQYKARLNEAMFDDNAKALGILFQSNEDEEEREFTPYEWDREAVTDLIKSMGYEDYEEVASEFTHYFSPGDEDEIRIFRAQENNPELEPTDLTIGMYKRSIEKEFEK
jgi:hypothetical protein